jgi:hypothetical protein
MDLGAFVQENKRWLLACALGLVVFFVARAVIGAVYDPAPLRGQAQAIVRGAQQNPVHDAQAQQVLRAEGEQLERERQRLLAELAFTPDPVYQFEGKGMAPDEYLGKVGRELRLRIRRGASERDVELQDKDLAWPSPTNVDEIRSVLFGLELIDVASQRLFAAHDAVRALDPLAPGLLGLQLRIEERRRGRPTPRSARGAADVEIKDLLTQESVWFQFQSDVPTALAFLESLRQAGRTLTLEAPVTMSRPDKRGDPLTVKGTLTGIAPKREPD